MCRPNQSTGRRSRPLNRSDRRYHFQSIRYHIRDHGNKFEYSYTLFRRRSVYHEGRHRHKPDPSSRYRSWYTVAGHTVCYSVHGYCSLARRDSQAQSNRHLCVFELNVKFHETMTKCTSADTCNIY